MALAGCTLELLRGMAAPALRALQIAAAAQIAMLDALIAQKRMEIARLDLQLVALGMAEGLFNEGMERLRRANAQYPQPGMLAAFAACTQVGEWVTIPQQLDRIQTAADDANYSMREYVDFSNQENAVLAEYEKAAELLRDIDFVIDALIDEKLAPALGAP